MTVKFKRTGLPAELEAAVAAHAAAIVAGDDRVASAFVDERAALSAKAVIAQAAPLRPLQGAKVIARARLGFHYIIKLRLIGANGAVMTLQNRWHRESGETWRLIEIENLGLRSPWKKPEDHVATKGAQSKALR